MDFLNNALPLLIDYSKLDFSLPALCPLIEDLEFLYLDLHYFFVYYNNLLFIPFRFKL